MSKSTTKTNNSEKNNQLTDPAGYDVKRMMFAEPVVGSVKDSPITYKRVPISTLNKDGSVGDLILGTSRLFSFGVSQNINPETKKPNGYTLPLCLWNRDGATPEEKAFTDTFDKIVNHTKQYLLRNKEDLEQYELEEAHLNKFNPLYWKKEKGKIVAGTGPTLYVKLIESKKNNKFVSMFFDKNNQPVDPLSLIGKYCWATAGIKIESIYIGTKITLQVKLYEAVIELAQSNTKPLLARPPPTGTLKQGGTNMNDLEDENNEEQEKTPKKGGGDGSVENSDVEVDDEPVKKPPSKPVANIKRNVKSVKTKAT